MTKPKPTNQALYDRVKRAVYRRIPKHSAYRSSQVVKEYKAKGGTYSGSKAKGGLTRWHKEKWRNQRGEEGYRKKGDIYRPTRRVSEKTPTTMGELSKLRKSRAIQEKKKTGRVKKY